MSLPFCQLSTILKKVISFLFLPSVVDDEDVVDARRPGDNLANSPKGNLASNMIEAFSFFFILPSVVRNYFQ